MKPFVTTLSIIGGLLLVGAVILLVSSGGNMHAALGMEERVQKSWNASGPVTSVKISTSDDNVVFRQSEDGGFSVTYYESDSHTFDITQDGGSLNINYKKAWLPSISFGKAYTMTVSMPASDMEKLDASVSSGSISLDMGIRVGNLSAHTSSGSVSLVGFAADTLSAGSTSGSVSISNAKAGIAEARISSGSITFAGVVADKLVTSSTSGPTRLEGCIIRELDMHASSGNVTSVGLDAGTAAVGVTSGNVSLELAVADPTLYRLELSSTSGSITVSGGGYETSAFRNLRLGIGGQLIKIGVSSGNIAVRFKDAAGQ